NTSSKYTRNFFRNELIPQLRSIYPQVEENLLRNIERFGQATHLYSQCVDELKKKVCEVRGEEVHIPVRKLLKYKHTSLIYEIIKDYGFGEGAVGEVLKLAEAESGKYIAADRYRIIRHRRWFIIAPKTVTAQMFVIEKGDSLLHFDEWQLSVKRVSQQGLLLNTSPAVAQLDAREIEYPLLLRKWKAGDYFYPLGMKKKKKLARFFIDQKLSKTEKEKVWVLESHKRIVWVVGHRIDDRFKLTAKTTEVLLLAQKR
ncbi:MAG TPA: tRNA lysidine(34) synthetase TilS, partial [Flavisolibacter sp.]|nr:tRNA lysidine(34) synthetase TilS [Flavisolibacter sp.]